MPYGDDCCFSKPRGYAPIVISTDHYFRQEGVGQGVGPCRGSRVAGVLVGRLVKPSVLWLDAITCFAAGE